MLLGMLGTIIVSTGDAIMKCIGFCFSWKNNRQIHVDQEDAYKKLID